MSEHTRKLEIPEPPILKAPGRPQMTEPKLTKDEFCARFKAHMLEFCEKFDDGKSVADYADETAISYFECQYLDSGESPEECAEADMSYWGE